MTKNEIKLSTLGILVRNFNKMIKTVGQGYSIDYVINQGLYLNFVSQLVGHSRLDVPLDIVGLKSIAWHSAPSLTLNKTTNQHLLEANTALASNIDALITFAMTNLERSRAEVTDTVITTINIESKILLETLQNKNYLTVPQISDEKSVVTIMPEHHIELITNK